jgi:hypothetical protein
MLAFDIWTLGSLCSSTSFLFFFSSGKLDAVQRLLSEPGMKIDFLDGVRL